SLAMFLSASAAASKSDWVGRVSRARRDYNVLIGYGELRLSSTPEGLFPSFSPQVSESVVLGITYWRDNNTSRLLVIPLAYLTALFGIVPSLWVVRVLLQNRHKRNPLICAKCGYDLRATPERCPECGTVPPTLS